MSDHTPGPWVFEDPKDLPHPMGMLAILAFKCSAMPQASGGSIPRGEMDVNRILAAAAPDMLAALKFALSKLLDEAEARNYNPPVNTDVIGALEAAISKAEARP